MVLSSTIAEINLNSFDNNIRLIREIAKKSKLIFVVKANAYGHGIVSISEAAIKANVDALAVATVNEGVKIRQGGITAPIILLFQHSKSESELVCHYNLIPIISDSLCLPYYEDYLKRYKKILNVYLKVDTGLGRMGVNPEEILDFAKKVLSYEHIKIDGISTHFASADGDDLRSVSFTKNQIISFRKTIDILKSNSIEIKNIHAANSAATLAYPEAHFNSIRFGLAGYGYSPNISKNPGLKPVMSLKSKVTLVKKIKKGSSVSYGMTWTADRETKIAVIPIGYADGFSRRFSNNGELKIKEKYYPIIGRVCMDETIIDVGNDNVYAEDEVLIFGDDERLNARTLSERMEGSIPYEILTSVGERVERVYIRG